ncbi:AraC family transcriptional regulator [Janthinobacterium lividum]|uniref:AraC family transcriptional regulator n=1 Tax=Janthinobacterium lividum TaxID=29581 RepID=UPI0008741087|nr:AraC family transcriptional regulator [Janthinobacterium lividum]MCC7713218.1 AraC family transcriptional regulator [Janthinobacterium lividum]OEZ51311.1 HTH-type transcriptional activator RhaS [Janthinobacterium lividum]WQE26288.1 AraC family transcriptional regulator [Janthinobacterium lividum]STQ97179.1 L-rhamnose operon regulatory protein rhaS [Janthinobacterium lividum]
MSTLPTPLPPQDEIAALISRHAPRTGDYTTAIGNLTFHRQSSVTESLFHAARPSVAIIAQGAKDVTLGSETFHYSRMQYLLTSVDLPVQVRVVEASVDKPHLCVVLGIDIADVAALLDSESSSASAAQQKILPATRGISVSDVSAELLDAMLRLVRLLDKPGEIATLAPLIRRELTYRLLNGPVGARLRHMALASSQSHQVGQAIDWIKHNYCEPLRIEHLAGMANMSMSSLHHHFKAITAMTPMQYQKLLRLQEARRLMLVEQIDAGTAGYRVGYASESQFSREYSRQFGRAPMRDVGQVRAQLSGSSASADMAYSVLP